MNYHPQIHPIDQVGVGERASRLFSRSIKKESKIRALKLALSMIDLTTLEGKDSLGKVRQLCYKASHLHDQFSNLPQVAAVCMYPNMVEVAKKALKSSSIKIAAVATAFPSGMATLEAKLNEVKS
ncbi:MAG TPA: deoxyribose-phosphate aldolase, partial [Candidatus Marinimicrobia bacterium]|nr:deoxyribose-phosphate aldolase [Candidatus Neomarinimicrobiota bacterium]